MKKHLKLKDPRGKKHGRDTPLICAPLVGRTRERVLAEAGSIIAQKPDLIEWRVDYFSAIGDTAVVIDTARALRAMTGGLPVIFTRRSALEGGERIAIDEEQVIALYEAMSASRLIDYVDYEMGNDPRDVARVRDFTRAHNVGLILSYHNNSYTPGQEYLVTRFLEAERLGADVAKVATMPRDRMDVLNLMVATAQADDKTKIPLISMSTGPLGSVSRMLGGLFGSVLSFAVGESASAPGQIPIGDLVAIYDVIRRSRGGEML